MKQRYRELDYPAVFIGVFILCFALVFSTTFAYYGYKVVYTDAEFQCLNGDVLIFEGDCAREGRYFCLEHGSVKINCSELEQELTFKRFLEGDFG